MLVHGRWGLVPARTPSNNPRFPVIDAHCVKHCRIFSAVLSLDCSERMQCSRAHLTLPSRSQCSSGLKKYLPGTDDLHLVGIEGLLDIATSPFKIKVSMPACTPQSSLTHPPRASDRPGSPSVHMSPSACHAEATPLLWATSLISTFAEDDNEFKISH